MPEPARTFGDEDQAAAFCSQQGEATGRLWIMWRIDGGDWGVGETTLPWEAPSNQASTESKPRPPFGTDPSIGRAGGPPVVGGG